MTWYDCQVRALVNTIKGGLWGLYVGLLAALGIGLVVPAHAQAIAFWLGFAVGWAMIGYWALCQARIMVAWFVLRRDSDEVRTRELNKWLGGWYRGDG